MGKRQPMMTIDLPRARAHWHARQGLIEPAGKRPDAVVTRTSWPRTLGGIEAYVAIAARGTEITAAAIHRAVKRGALRVVPAVRGCIYLVPAAEAPAVLRFAEQLSASRTERDLAKAGVKPAEIKRLVAMVQAWLTDNGPATTDAIRKGLPKGSVRSLGAVGTKIGLSSPLPVALRTLEFAGAIVRTLPGGRLDNERYAWAAVPPDEVEQPPGGFEPLVDTVVQRFLQSAGPATAKEIATWAGVTQRDVKAALLRLSTEELRIEGNKAAAFVLPGELDALAKPAEPSTQISLLPFGDNYVAQRGGPGRLVDPQYHGLPVEVWGYRKDSTLGEAGHLSLRPVLCGDRIVGFWEYDPDKQQVVHVLFDRVPRGTKTALRREAEALTTLITEIGHGKSFSLDTDDDLRRRAAKLPTLAS
jgi:hypothetical protein